MRPKRQETVPAEAAVPKEPVLHELLARARTRLPDLTVDSDAVETSLAALAFATRALAAVETHFRRYGLSQARFSVLMLLFFESERIWTPALLAESLDVSRPTITGVLNVLEVGGWLERTPHPEDGRKIAVRLTRSGSRRFRRILPDHFARVSKAFSGRRAAYAGIRKDLGALLDALRRL